MNDRPDRGELLEAVRRFLADEVVPALGGHLKYQARVAANVVAIVAREIANEERQLEAEWRRLAVLMEEPDEPPAASDARRRGVAAWTEQLCARIREGEADAGAWRDAVIAHLRRTVADKLEVAKGRVPGD